MGKGSPSLVALLGLLAVGGYQNRARLGEMLGGRTGGDDPSQSGAGQSSSGGGLLDSLQGMMGGSGGQGGQGGLMGGLAEMMQRFTDPHQAAKAQSWVRKGANEPIAPTELEHALDEDTLAELTQKTGLSRSEMLNRLSTVLPEAVDQATPDGVFPGTDQQRGVY